jgi:hypothetical protein
MYCNGRRVVNIPDRRVGRGVGVGFYYLRLAGRGLASQLDVGQFKEVAAAVMNIYVSGGPT